MVKLISAQEIANIVGVTKRTIQVWRVSGLLPKNIPCGVEGWKYPLKVLSIAKKIKVLTNHPTLRDLAKNKKKYGLEW